MHNRRPSHPKDPVKYRGGKGSKYNRKFVKNGTKTKHEFIDKRANTAEEPVYVKITHYRRDNPKSSNWRGYGQPEYITISKPVFMKEFSEEHRIAIENSGNYAKFEADERFPNTRYILNILDGDRLEQEVREYRLMSDPAIGSF